MAEQDEGFSSFLSGLLKAISSGAQSTKDAFFEDVDAVKEGRMPPQAKKAGIQVLSQMGSPSVNPTIPALTATRRIFDPAKGWIDAEQKLYPGGDLIQMIGRTGGFGEFLRQLFRGMDPPRTL